MLQNRGLRSLVEDTDMTHPIGDAIRATESSRSIGIQTETYWKPEWFYTEFKCSWPIILSATI